MSIDWEQLAQRIDFPSDSGVARDGERARRALVVLLGERTVLDVLDFVLANQPGQGLAGLVLQVLSPSHPDSAVREIGPRIRDELDFWGGEVRAPEGAGATLAEAISPGGAIVEQAMDWGALARSLGTVHSQGESVSLEDALLAIQMILGQDFARTAVDDYVAQRPGRELARAILQLLGSMMAVRHCQEICRTGESPEMRAKALDLLCVIADYRAIPWIEEFLEDPEVRLQEITARHLTYLARENHLNDTARGLLPWLEGHQNPAVREAAVAFGEYFQRVDQEESP